MKKFLSLLILALFLTLPVTANAVTIINDEYYGADDHEYDDVIGSDLAFDISKMEVDYSGGILTVDIYSRYLDNISALETTLTDLFISTDGWNPITTRPNYLDDWSLNGEDWEYALVMDDHEPAGISGDLDLFSTTQGTIENSDDAFRPADGSFRDGQEVLFVPNTNETALATGTWSISRGGSDLDDFIRFVVDFDFPNTEPLAFHYASAICANDVIEGQVPEPATFLLSGLGLLGMGCFLRRKLKKA